MGDNTPQQIDTPPYPNTTKIDNGQAYDVAGKVLGAVDDDGKASAAVDYDALAKQAGSVGSAPQAAAVDYDALAKQAGSVGSSPSTPQPEKEGWFHREITAPFMSQVHRIRDSILENEGPGWLPYDVAQHFKSETPPPPATDEEAVKNLKARNASTAPDQIEIEKQNIDKIRADRPFEERNAKQYVEGGTRLLSPEKLMTPEQKKDNPVLFGLLRFTGSLTSQENLEIVAGTQGLGFLGEAAAVSPQLGMIAKAVAATPRAVSMYFAGQMAIGTAQAIPGLYQAKKDYDAAVAAGDQDKAAQIKWDATVQATETAASAYMTYAAAHHGITGKAEPIGQHAADAARETLQYAAETGVEAGRNAAAGVKAGAQAVKNAAGSVANNVGKLGRVIGRTNNFETAISRAAKITPKNAEAMKSKIADTKEDLQAILNNNPDVKSPTDVADAIEQHLQKNEAHMQREAGATQDENVPVAHDFKERVSDRLDKFFQENRGKYGSPEETAQAKKDILDRVMQRDQVDAGLDGKPTYKERIPNLFETENTRQGLNNETKPQYSTNAKPTTDAYKAGAAQAVQEIRSIIDGSYHERGIQNVQEFREKEAKLLDIEKALRDAQDLADKMGEGTVFQSLMKKFGTPSAMVAVLLGHFAGVGAGVLGAGATVLGDQIYQNVKNPNVNIGRAADIAAKNPNAVATSIDINPNAPGPAAAPPTPPAPPPIDHATHAALSSYYGKIVGAVPHDELEKQFMDEIHDAAERQKLGTQTPADVQQSARRQSMLERLNESRAKQRVEAEKAELKAKADAEKAQAKAAEVAAKKAEADKAKEEAEKAAAIEAAKDGSVKTDVNPELDRLGRGDESGLVSHHPTMKAHAPTQPISGMPEGTTTEDAHVHEWAHNAIGAVDGLEPLEIRSDTHPKSTPGAGATSVFKTVSIRDAAGNVDPEALANQEVQWLTQKMAGPASHEVFQGLTREEVKASPTTRTDFRNARAIIREVHPDFTASQVEQAVDLAYDRARDFLTKPHIADRIRANAAVREEGLSPTLHASHGRVTQFAEDIRNAHNEYTGTDTEPDGGGSGESGEKAKKPATKDGKKDAGAGKDGLGKGAPKPAGEAATARGVAEQQEFEELNKGSNVKTTPKSFTPTGVAESQVSTSLGGMEDEDFGYMRPDGTMAMSDRLSSAHSNGEGGTHDDLARINKESMEDILGAPGGVKFGMGKKGGFLRISNSEPKTIKHALRVIDSLPTDHIDFDYTPRPGEGQYTYFEGTPKEVSRLIRRPGGIGDQAHDLGDLTPALAESHVTAERLPKKPDDLRVPQERTTGEHDDAIKQGGAIPGGIQKGDPEINIPDLALFHDPLTGSTLALPTDKITPENVRASLRKSRDMYIAAEDRKAAAQKPTDAAAGAGPDVQQPADSPVVRKLLNDYGQSQNPLSTGFILSDGRRVHLGNADHAAAVRVSTPVDQRSPNQVKDLEDFINREKAVRTRFRTGKGGDEVVFSIPKSGVSEDQISQMRQAVGKMGRYGNAVMEIADSEGKSAQKEFVRPSDIDSMLQEIGAHPDNKSLGEHELRNAADEFNKQHGRPPINTKPVGEDPRSSDVADSYKNAVHSPNDPAVKASYDALKRDIDEQYELAKRLGIKMDVKDENPYGLSKETPAHEELHNDVRNNKHLSVWSGGKPPADHPMSELDPKTGLTYNDKFRMVHDIFGHAGEKQDFSPSGEETAWNLHRQMFSPEARPALATDTKGQAAYTYKYGDFPPQKAALLPPEHQVRPEDLPTDTGAGAGLNIDLEKHPAGGINPVTGSMDSKRYGLEIHPEDRETLDSNPTQADFQRYAAAHSDVLGKHPDIKLGWDTLGDKPEMNIGISTDNLDAAKKVGEKLDQRSIWDTQEKTEIPTGGKNTQREFPDYPIEDRLKDLAESNVSKSSKKENKKWYHGTSEENHAKILEQGQVRPGQPSIYKEDQPRHDAVYVTTDPETGKMYAEEGGRKGKVIQVKVDPKKLVPDEDDVHDLLESKKSELTPAAQKMQSRLHQIFLDAANQQAKEDGFEPFKSFEEAKASYDKQAEEWYGNQSGELAERVKQLTDRVVEKDPELAKQIINTYGKAAHLGAVDLAESNVTKEKSPEGSSVPLMDNPLPLKPSTETGVPSTTDVAMALSKYTNKKIGSLVLGKAETGEQVARAKSLAEDEARYQLAQDNTGAAWYTTDMKKHDEILQAMRPELKDPAKLSVFKMVEAILSSGQKPYANFKSAVKAWDFYHENDSFPETNPDTEMSWGPRGVKAYGNALSIVNRLIDEKGEQGASDWLLADHTVKELREYNNAKRGGGGGGVAGKVDDVLPGTMVLGPKRGPFAQNLHGQESAFTADMWVARSWHRWMGTAEVGPDGEMVTDRPINAKERELMKQSFKETADKMGITTSSLQAILWYYEQGLYSAHGSPKESWSFSDAAQRASDEEASSFNFGRNAKEKGGFSNLGKKPLDNTTRP